MLTQGGREGQKVYENGYCISSNKTIHQIIPTILIIQAILIILCINLMLFLICNKYPHLKSMKVTVTVTYIHQWGKTFFFHQKSEGIAFTFCRYLNQNMRAFKFCRYCLQKYFLIPSNFDEKNTIEFWGQYPGNFETKFFPLRFEGILYNSVAPHSTSQLSCLCC